MRIKCILYDCVGPLLVKNPSAKIDPQTAEIDHLCGTAVNDKQFWDKISDKYKLSISDIKSVVNKIAKSYMKNEPMWTFHEEIKDKYKTAIVNNGTSVIFSKWIKKFELKNKFDGLFNSSKLGVRKPDKKIFEICTSEMNVKLTETLLIDDSQHNVEGAIDAGLKGLYYNPSDHKRFITEFKNLASLK